MAKSKQAPRPAAPQQRTQQTKPAPATKPVAKPAEEPVAKGPADKWLIMVLVAFALIVNVRTISYDYTLDDPFFTKDNPFVKQGLSSVKDVFTHAAYYGVFKNHDASYRPFLLTSFALENQLFGFEPKISHIVNLILFATLLATMFLLLRRLFKDYSPYIPFFIVLLFSVHPIHTEVVASIKSRDEIMALLFSCMCMLQSIKFVDTEKTKNLVLSGLYFFFALMSKESPVTLVALMPLTIYFFRNTTTKNIVRATVPYVIVAVIYLLMRVAFVENDSGPVVILANNNALMAAKSYSEKLGTALFIQLKYIILLVFPHPLSWDYSYNQIPIIDITNIKALASIAVIGAMLFYAIKNIGKKDIFAYCILFYAASVVITSNIVVTIGATMAERFIFTGSLAFCMAVVFLLMKVFKTDKVNISFANAKNLFVVVCIIGVLYAGKTMARNEVWQNNTTLYESGTETAPESWRVHYLLAVEYTKQISASTNPAEKRELFNKSLAHYNKSDSIMPNNSDLILLRGYAYEFAGMYDSAYSNYYKVSLLDKGNKTAYNNMGSILLRKGSFQEGITVLAKALALDSNYTEALANTGACYGNSGNFPEAAKYYEHAVRVNPEQPKNVWQSMTNIYTFMGDSAHAQKYRALLMRSK